jgi:Ca2+-binding EF-hand superfamily protein
MKSTVGEGSKIINAREFKMMMMGIGESERLTEAEMDELYQDMGCDPNGGHFNLEEFIQLILKR